MLFTPFPASSAPPTHPRTHTHSASGADPESARSFLLSDEGKLEIEAAQRRLSDLGIHGIPTLIVGGKWQLPSGAIGATTLVGMFRELEAQGGAPGPPMFSRDLNLPRSVTEEVLAL